MANLTKIQQFLPKSFFIVFNNNTKSYFRPYDQRYSPIGCHGVWSSEEDALKDIKEHELKDYDIRELNVSDIHPDFIRLYESFKGELDLIDIFRQKMSQLITINIFMKR